jgi:DnaJ family protein C protein 8
LALYTYKKFNNFTVFKMASQADDKAQQPPVVEDSRDALEVLEAEAKEWEKDAEINRILQAFRLDA